MQRNGKVNSADFTFDTRLIDWVMHNYIGPILINCHERIAITLLTKLKVAGHRKRLRN